jgi:hypothetical protein
MSISWVVTMTRRGSPSEANLVDLEAEWQLHHEGSVAAIPRLNQFTVTAFVDAPEPEKAWGMVVQHAEDLVRNYISGDEGFVGVEVVEENEYDRRADEPSFPEIVSAPDVAEILGVTRQRVHQLLGSSPTFPEPIMRLGSGPLWSADAIRRFDKQWQRKPGRPSKAG